MSAEDALDRVYSSAPDPETQQALYDDWAATYDRDLEESGYATPGRVAESVGDHVDDRSAPILDFGCGSGMSGRALAGVGFTTIDGVDLSGRMLDQAATSGHYRRLWQMTAGELAVTPGSYRALVACGVISVGAAPAETLALVASVVGPGDVLVFSYNDHTLDAPEYTSALADLLDTGFEQLGAESGVHIASRGSTSTVYTLRRTG